MSSDKERKGFVKGTALGVAIGGLVGAAAGILFAPQSGKETRAQIARTLQTASRDLEKKIKEVEKKVSDFSDAAGKDLSELLDRATAIKVEIVTFTRSGISRSSEITADARKEAQRLMDESKKLIADLDRILDKKMSEAGGLAKDTGKEIKDTVKRNVKK